MVGKVSVSYEQGKLQLLNAKFEALATKAKLPQKPKLKLRNQFAPASYGHSDNIIYFNKQIIEKWEQGIVEENEIDYSLAHEFGHAIAYTKQKDWMVERKMGYALALFFSLLVAFAAHISLTGFGSIISGVIITAIILAWLFFLPWVLRRIHVPWELLANKYAIAYSLISDEDMAIGMLHFTQLEKIGPIKLLKILRSIIIHPFLAENLENIGFTFRDGTIERITKK